MKPKFFLSSFAAFVLLIGTADAQIARWRLEGNPNDAVGSANGTVNSTPVYSTTIQREGNQSLQFDGNNDYIIMMNPGLPSGSAARTISAWARSDVNVGLHTIFAYGNYTNGQMFYIGMTNAQLIAGAYGGDDLTYNNVWQTVNTWHHIALSYDGTTARLYVDGAEVSSGARSWSTGSVQTANIGRHQTNMAYWDGYVDDVRVYNTALSANDILALATLPPAPTSATATGASTTTMNLSWSEAATTETGFQIERSTTSGSGYAIIATTAANATTFQDTGLTLGTTYYYRMRAVANNANSAYTSQFTGATWPNPPTAPTGLSASAISGNTINLTWTDASNNETGFEVERSTTSGSGFTLVATTAANATSYSDNTCLPSTTYYYKIRSKNTGGTSSYTSESSATTMVALAARWRLEGNGNDAIGSANASGMNTPTYNTNAREGSQSVAFNGVNQYMVVTSPTLPSAHSPRTIAAWVMTNSTAAGARYAFSYGGTGNQQAMYIGMSGSTPMGGATGQTNHSGSTLTIGTWAHLALTYDGTTGRLYVNGTQVSSGSNSWNLVPGNANIGRHIASAGPWNGQVDDVRVYNMVLSASEILELATVPVVPTSPAAAGSLSTAMNVTWTDASSNESGFQIERSTTSGSGYSVIATTAANATSYQDTGLAPLTTYYYRIKAVADNANSSYTSEFTSTTLMPEPTSPAASSLSATSIKIDWTDATSNETGFQIERSTTSGSGFALVTTTAVNTSTFTDTGLTSATQYYYRVRAINATANSGWTAELTATTSSQTPPSVPTSPGAIASSPTSIVVNWTDGSNNETGFEVERGTASTGPFTLVITTAPNATSHNDESLTPNTAYYYRIRATNAAGPSAYTTVATATTPLAPPAAPTSLSAVPAVASINLTWTDNASNESEFIIERSTSSGTGFTMLSTVPPNTISYSDASATAGQPFFYRIRATNAGGNSAYTDEVTATLSIAGVTQLCKGLFCDENGNVGVGTQVIPSGYKLSVKGKVMAEGVRVDLQTAWPDYVFDERYKLTDLPTLRSYIDSNNHLPGMPTATEVEKEGIDVGEINTKLLEKIEELSLYMIQMEERVKKLEEENKTLKSQTDHK